MTTSGISASRWQKIWSLVQACGELPPDRWRDYVTASGADSRVIDEALKILAESTALDADVPLPETIGNYRILEKVDEGGMGAVYRAEQASPRRVVALKMIKPGHVTAAHLRRFELEGQVLGRLRHTGIAQIYECGTAQNAGVRQPFLAMEYVDGVSLIEFANTRRADVKARLLMLLKVCHAVQHAHEQGIIHRDLKPSNILVTQDGHRRSSTSASHGSRSPTPARHGTPALVSYSGRSST